MAKKKKAQVMKLSYESDGKMGQSVKGDQKKQSEKEFFNTTPGSE